MKVWICENCEGEQCLLIVSDEPQQPLRCPILHDDESNWEQIE
jgi:hypothetical protein